MFHRRIHCGHGAPAGAGRRLGGDAAPEGDPGHVEAALALPRPTRRPRYPFLSWDKFYLCDNKSGEKNIFVTYPFCHKSDFLSDLNVFNIHLIVSRAGGGGQAGRPQGLQSPPWPAPAWTGCPRRTRGRLTSPLTKKAQKMRRPLPSPTL
jgi:hypothetical protein